MSRLHRLVRGPSDFIRLLCAQQRRNREREFKNSLNGQPEAIDAGRKLFAGACGVCHGPNGEGGRGPNLTTGRETRRLDDRGLFDSIRKGVPGTDMPPSNLPEDKLWQVVAFVRALSAPAFESRVPGDVEAGGALFFGKAGCSECHAILGRGGRLGPDRGYLPARTIAIIRPKRGIDLSNPDRGG